MKKVDMHSLVRNSNLLKEYSDFFDICAEFLKNNYQEKEDPLILEILLYVIDFLNLVKYPELHDMLNDNNIIYTIASMLSIHTNKHILKSISVVLANASKCIIFNADLLIDNRMESIVKNILLAGSDQER